MLKASGLTKYYNGREIFSDFSLALAPGCFQVLLGPSGCGKSTLFDTLTGVAVPDSGRLLWHGRTVPHLGKIAAYMQQKDLLLPWFSLLDNAMLPVRTRKQSDAASLSAAKDLAGRLFSRLGLEGYEHHRPRQVSGGMRQRCALVRTLMFNRDLILLDEPLSALDALTRRRLQSLLLLLQTEFNKTILMITHDIDEALVLGDEILLLSPKPMRVQKRFTPECPKPRAFDHPILLGMKTDILTALGGMP